jgi:hypothetical protein
LGEVVPEDGDIIMEEIINAVKSNSELKAVLYKSILLPPNELARMLKVIAAMMSDEKEI